MAHKRLNRIVRSVNAAIAVMLLVALAAVYWYAYRPLPQTAGSIAAFVSRPASASRDALGVPHIRAATEEDALFVQGYVTAQDRLFQMDGLRRSTAGTLAESPLRGRSPPMRSRGACGCAGLPRSLISPCGPATARCLPPIPAGLMRSSPTHIGRLPLSFSAAGVRSAPLERRGLILARAPHVSHAHNHMAQRPAEGPQLARPMPGKSASLPSQDRAGSQVPPGLQRLGLSGGAEDRNGKTGSSPTICTWNGRCPASGTWCTCRLPVWTWRASRFPASPASL